MRVVDFRIAFNLIFLFRLWYSTRGCPEMIRPFCKMGFRLGPRFLVGIVFDSLCFRCVDRSDFSGDYCVKGHDCGIEKVSCHKRCGLQVFPLGSR